MMSLALSSLCCHSPVQCCLNMIKTRQHCKEAESTEQGGARGGGGRGGGGEEEEVHPL